MQCPRCYFTNPSGSRVCEYCGARLEGTTEAGGAGGSASEKRKTMLGPAPSIAESAPPAKHTRLDPDDPFRIAAQGVPPPNPADPAAFPGDFPDLPRGSSNTITPPEEEETESPRLPKATPLAKLPKIGRIDPDSVPTAPERNRHDPSDPPPAPRRPVSRATIVTLPRPKEPAVAGAAVVIPRNGPSRAILLREGRTRIGRRGENEIMLEDPKVSSDHALIRIEGGRAWLLDTSANGTVVSGIRCVNDRADIADGTVLRVGDTQIVIMLLGEDALTHLAGEL